MKINNKIKVAVITGLFAILVAVVSALSSKGNKEGDIIINNTNANVETDTNNNKNNEENGNTIKKEDYDELINKYNELYSDYVNLLDEEDYYKKRISELEEELKNILDDESSKNNTNISSTKILPYDFYSLKEDTGVFPNEYVASIFMGGTEYKEGVLLTSNNKIYYNLGGEYNKLTITYGHVDNTDIEEDKYLGIYLDNNLYKKIEIDGNALPQTVELELNYCKQLTFEIINEFPTYSGGRYGIIFNEFET